MIEPRISVIIPHYRDFERLGICLDALMAQTMPRRDFEIVVADNASPEGPSAVEEAIAGRARLVIVTEKGAGPARNGGFAAARGEILAFTDSDCKPEPGWLEAGVKALDQFDFVGGRVRVSVDDPVHITPVEAFEKVFAFDFRRYIENHGFTGSGNLFCRRAVFEQVGGFRAAVSEDVEWSRRARAGGFRLGYAPQAVLSHPARRTWEELLLKWRRVNRESFLLMTEKPGGRLKWLLRSQLLPASALAHTPRVMSSEELSTFGDRLAALGILFRLRFWRWADSIALLARAPR